MFRAPVGNALRQDFFEGFAKGIRCQQERYWSRKHDNVFRGFFDLSEPFEKGYRRGNIFDTNAQQGRHRHIEKLGQAFERFDLGNLAFLESIQRSARYPETRRNFVRAET